MKRILFYKTGLNISYETSLLTAWGLDKEIEIIIVSRSSELDLESAIKKYNAQGVLVVFEKVTRDTIQNCKELKIVAIPSIGYNNIDVKAAKESGVVVCNVPDYCLEEVAHHTISLAMDLARKITFINRDVVEGNWNINASYPINRVSGKIFGLVFFGAIPQKMVPILKAFGFNIAVYAPTKSKEYLNQFGCQKIETLKELAEVSDFISVHAPLSESTHHMIDEEILNSMKPSSYLINTARGGVINEEALYQALLNKKIKAAAVDVIEDELNKKSKLIGLDNAIVTPHTAFLSEEALLESRNRSLKGLVDYLLFNKNPENQI